MGKPLRNGGSHFLGKRRERTLECECRFVNGTLVGAGLETLIVLPQKPFHFSRNVDEQVFRLPFRK